jgi:ubiquinone/menaquinone biosynthesis C-methylase UbiE
MSDAKRIVAEGYDAIGERWLDFHARVEGSPHLRYAEELLALLPPRPDVLELGCAAGVGATELLAERTTLTAVDISPVQIELARKRIPGATFVAADFTQLELEPESFDAVAAFYSLTHVPQAELPGLLANIARWLGPGGAFLGTFGAKEKHETVEAGWLGGPMFFSSLAPEESRALVEASGLAIVRDAVETIEEPLGYGTARFLWILAQKPPR